MLNVQTGTIFQTDWFYYEAVNTHSGQQGSLFPCALSLCSSASWTQHCGWLCGKRHSFWVYTTPSRETDRATCSDQGHWVKLDLDLSRDGFFFFTSKTNEMKVLIALYENYFNQCFTQTIIVMIGQRANSSKRTSTPGLFPFLVQIKHFTLTTTVTTETVYPLALCLLELFYLAIHGEKYYRGAQFFYIS